MATPINYKGDEILRLLVFEIWRETDKWQQMRQPFHKALILYLVCEPEKISTAVSWH